MRICIGIFQKNNMTDKNTSKTCGVYYKEAISHFTGGDPEKMFIFDAGNCRGQAEKIFLGACKAMIARPPMDWRSRYLEIAEYFAHMYGLVLTHIGDEVWMSCPENKGEVEKIMMMEENSPEWHALRGALCGVPSEGIDLVFHLREGYGERTLP